MKKILTLSICAMLGLSAMAQQLPNVGFEAWKETCGSTEAFGDGGVTSKKEGEFRQRPGSEPQGWNGSSVNQRVLMEKKETLVFEDTYVGKALKLQNKFVGVGNLGAVAPGFVTLGTPWVYAIANTDVCDGGTYGGVEFTDRPDELQFDIKRSDNNEEISSVIAYFWNGEFKSKVGMAGAPTQTRSDVDRAVLGKVNSDEGSTGKLLASIDETITTTNGDWMTFNYPIEWAGDETPDKMNVIICSGDYWNRGKMKDNTEIIVDNVKFIYYSRLKSLTVGETTVALEEGKYDYEFDFVMPDNNEAFVYELLGKDATATVTRDEANHTATIKVTNVDADLDGEKEHSYVLSFAAPESYSGTLAVELLGSALVQNATIEILPSGKDVVTFKLPNFALGEDMQLGDIVVENVTVTDVDGTKHYEGSKPGLELLGGAITADVTLNGTIESDGNVNMNIDVVWDETPIYVDFYSKAKESETFTGYIGHKNEAEGAVAKEYEGKMSFTPVSRNTYRFEMPNVDLGTLARAAGNIVVEGVTMTTDDKGVRTFTSENNGDSNVTLNGTIDANNSVNLKLTYKSNDTAEPIYLEFNTQKATVGIDGIEADENAQVEYFNLQGIRVANPENGVYIRRQGSKVSKVFVK